MRAGPTGSPVVRGFLTPRSTVDQKSIYVGNLPDGTGREELEDMFKEFGNIVQVNIIKKHYGKPSWRFLRGNFAINLTFISRGQRQHLWVR